MTISTLLVILALSLISTNRWCEGFTSTELAEGLGQIASNDANKKKVRKKVRLHFELKNIKVQSEVRSCDGFIKFLIKLVLGHWRIYLAKIWTSEVIFLSRTPFPYFLACGYSCFTSGTSDRAPREKRFLSGGLDQRRPMWSGCIRRLLIFGQKFK